MSPLPTLCGMVNSKPVIVPPAMRPELFPFAERWPVASRSPAHFVTLLARKILTRRMPPGSRVNGRMMRRALPLSP